MELNSDYPIHPNRRRDKKTKLSTENQGKVGILESGASKRRSWELNEREREKHKRRLWNNENTNHNNKINNK